MTGKPRRESTADTLRQLRHLTMRLEVRSCRHPSPEDAAAINVAASAALRVLEDVQTQLRAASCPLRRAKP